MADRNEMVRVEQVDWTSLFPFVHLFQSFRMAIHPPKLLLSLLLVIVLYLGGMFFDSIWGARVYPGEIEQYTALTTENYEQWRKTQDERIKLSLQMISPTIRTKITGLPVDASLSQMFNVAIVEVNESFDRRMGELAELPADSITPENLQRRHDQLRQERRDRLQAIQELQLKGIFHSLLRFKLDRFQRLIVAATSLRLGLDEFSGRVPHDPNTVIGSMRDIVITLPGWMYHEHCGFLVVWMLYALAMWSLLGGAIARLAALDATRRVQLPVVEAMRFSLAQFIWFFLAPLLPLIGAGIVGVLLALGGLVFFNIPMLDVLGALLFGFALIGGVIIALLLIGLVAGANLLYPAIATEGTDAFDACSRAFSFVQGRLWRLIFYNIVALVYGAATYLFVGLVIILAITVTQQFVSVGVLRTAADGQNLFDVILPQPLVGELAYTVPAAELSFTSKVASGLIWVWVKLLVGVLAAYAISYVFCAQTWIYLLLRRSADGMEFDQVYIAPEPATPRTAPTPEKVEPAPSDNTSSTDGDVSDTAKPEQP